MRHGKFTLEKEWLAGQTDIMDMINALLSRVEAGGIAPGEVVGRLAQFCPDSVWSELKSAARIAADESVLDEDDASWLEARDRAMAVGLLKWFLG